MSFNNFNTPEKLYYDVVISNLDSGNSLPQNLYFNETRNSPFVENPQEYLMSIVRFTLNTPTLPIWLCSIKPNQGDPNLSIYSISLKWTDPLSGQIFRYRQYLNYAPQDLASPIPIPPSQTINKLQNNQGGYYNVYNYQYVIFLVNQTFIGAFNGLNALVLSAGLALPSNFPPVMTFDTSTDIAILNSDILGYNTQQPNKISIYFNSSLYQLFSSFPVYILPDIANGEVFEIQTYTFGGQNISQFPSATTPFFDGIQTYQEYSTLSLWSPILSIVFCSNTIPMTPTQISAPQILVNGLVVGNNGNNANVANILTDFVASDFDFKPNIIYTPTSPFRFIELKGNRPMYNLDISVFWKNAAGELIPFKLSSGSSATIKFYFTKKTSLH
jgi:hypothetical protein